MIDKKPFRVTILDISGYSVLIDTEDLNIIAGYKWYVYKHDIPKGRYYFFSHRKMNDKDENISLHRLLMGCKKGDCKIVDHISGDTLDNRKCNLRLCNRTENARNNGAHKNNSTGYKGVDYIPRLKKYRARIRAGSKSLILGLYKDPKEAALAYNEKAKELHGEFARLNILKDYE